MKTTHTQRRSPHYVVRSHQIQSETGGNSKVQSETVGNRRKQSGSVRDSGFLKDLFRFRIFSCVFLSDKAVRMNSWLFVWMTVAAVQQQLISSSTGQRSCYQCYEENTSRTSTNTTNSTCGGESTSVCQGLVCLVIETDYGNYGSWRNLTCLTKGFQGFELPENFDYSVKYCEVLNFYQDKYTFYLNGAFCCADTSVSDTATNQTTCGCDTDYCNANNISRPTTTQVTTQVMTTDNVNEMTTKASKCVSQPQRTSFAAASLVVIVASSLYHS